jgi:hypothetical protein
MRRLGAWTLLGLAVLLAFALKSPAAVAADTSGSSNWSGYAVHAGHTSFKLVTGTWRQPAGNCPGTGATYSAFWVGIGGYSASSRALEQLGTELDCSAGGTAQLSAWYELLPAPVRKISMTIAPGDTITASVGIAGKYVTLTITDSTRNELFSRTILDHTIDQTSAEWIAEAPSACTRSSSCVPLPLTPFGSVAFSGASAETTTGHTGTISSSLWGTTKIVLARSPRFVSTAGQALAKPSALRNGGRAFTVGVSGTGPGGSGSPPSSAGGHPGSGDGDPWGHGGYPRGGGGGWSPGDG